MQRVLFSKTRSFVNSTPTYNVYEYDPGPDERDVELGFGFSSFALHVDCSESEYEPTRRTFTSYNDLYAQGTCYESYY